jgi:hypothetical protein
LPAARRGGYLFGLAEASRGDALQPVPLKAVVPEERRVLLYYDLSDCAAEVLECCRDYGFADWVRTRDRAVRLPAGCVITHAEKAVDAVRRFEEVVETVGANHGKEIALRKIFAIPWPERGLLHSDE